ncbi:arabinofuranosidase, partial [Colletotrichum plurivorum]
MKFLPTLFSIAAALGGIVSTSTPNSTFINPVLPGWHSDPSCIRVDDTFYCTISTFVAFPGLPVYASKDLVNWRFQSHAWNRDAQIPRT